MADERLSDKMNNYKPTKTVWFWSTAGAVAATVVLGFTVGGWVTGATAEERRISAVEGARAELVAAVCVERYMGAPDVTARLATLKETSSWKREDVIEEAGWVTMAGFKESVPDAAELCAEHLLEPPAEGMADAS